MHWLLKSQMHQQARYWLCRSDNIHCCSRVNFSYLGQARSRSRDTIQNVKISFIIFKTIQYVNSLAPGKFERNFRYIIFKRILVTDGWGISCEIAQIWMLLDLTDDKSISVQVMAWCRQATSHYLSQCWPRSMLPNGVSRPQWVNNRPLCLLSRWPICGVSHGWATVSHGWLHPQYEWQNSTLRYQVTRVSMHYCLKLHCWFKLKILYLSRLRNFKLNALVRRVSGL